MNKPKKMFLILLNSSKAIQRVFMPKNGETIDATTESYIYQVRLPDSLMSGLVFQNGKDNTQLAWVDGRIRKRKQAELNLDITETQKAALNESNGKEVKLYLDVDNKARDSSDDLEHDKRSIPTLEPIEEEELKGHQTSFINELKLSDFKIVFTFIKDVFIK